MKWKVGQVLYKVMTDEQDGTCETWEYVIRSIRNGRVFATHRSVYVTVDTKGRWLKSIPEWCRESWLVTPHPPHYPGGRPIGQKPDTLCTTKKAAARAALKDHDPRYFDDAAMFEKAGKTLKRMAA